MFGPDILLEEWEMRFLTLISEINDEILDVYEKKLQTIKWMMEAWISLDWCVTSPDSTGENGSIIIHIAISIGHLKNLYYLLYIIIIWDWLWQWKLD